jgi:predicted O-methyltransferase YrrM
MERGFGNNMKIKVDFNRDSMRGQMRPEERKAMYDLVIEAKPKGMLEIGTWKGGGSTYILGCAAYELEIILNTIEANKNFYDAAVKLFDERMVILKPHVHFHYGLSQDIIPILLKIHTFDFVLFDGAEDADQTVREYDLLNKSLGLGSHIACHDWKTLKMAKLKEVIANDNTWQNVVSLPHTDTGFMIFRRTV